MTSLSKHHKKGRSPKSPKFKHGMKREAEKNERKPRKSEMVSTTAELWRKK